jgi:hypothetical protein
MRRERRMNVVFLGFQEKGNAGLRRKSTWLISEGDWAWPNSG